MSYLSSDEYPIGHPLGPKDEAEQQRWYWHKKANDILEEAADRFNPRKIYCLCSGGKDSVVSTYLADYIIRCQSTRGYWSNHQPRYGPQITYLNTRTGIAANRDFVYRYTGTYFGESLFLEMTTPESYENWCLRHGFPGPSAHRWMYIRLKERCIEQLVRENTHQIDKRVLHEILNDLPQFHPIVQHFLIEQIRTEFQKVQESRKEQFLFITGARKTESARRAMHVTPIQVRGRQIWVSPLAEWPDEAVYDFRDRHIHIRNEVADILHRSKDCLCGAFGSQQEFNDICFWYPEEGAWLIDLQNRVHAAGFPWNWGEEPPKWWNQIRKGQLLLWPEEEEKELRLQSPRPDYTGFFPLCSTCTTIH